MRVLPPPVIVVAVRMGATSVALAVGSAQVGWENESADVTLVLKWIGVEHDAQATPRSYEEGATRCAWCTVTLGYPARSHPSTRDQCHVRTLGKTGAPRVSSYTPAGGVAL